MNSSPDTDVAELRDAAGRATAQLWNRRGRGVPAVAYAAALIGGDVGTLTDALSITLAASPEAATLLDGMELRIRTLPTGVDTHPERCIYSVRGPIMWSETITARANALGNEDVSVCSLTGRSFDTDSDRGIPQITPCFCLKLRQKVIDNGHFQYLSTFIVPCICVSVSWEINSFK